MIDAPHTGAVARIEPYWMVGLHRSDATGLHTVSAGWRPFPDWPRTRRDIGRQHDSVCGLPYDSGVSRGRPRAQTVRPSARQAAEEAVVRRYLRSVVGAPVRHARDAADAEAEFITAAKRWAERVGVDRGTLLALGVDSRVLDRAGVRTTPLSERLRRHWEPAPFSIADLARRSGLPESSVRRAVATDEAAGLLRRVAREDRTVLYGGE